MNSIFLHADDVLRGSPRISRSEQAAQPHCSLRQLAAIIVLCGLFYGAVMGTFSGVAGERIWQVLFSAIKVPLLLGATFALSLPSFFVLNALLGLRDDFAASLRALTATQAGLSLILAALAPFTLLWYASSSNYQGAILFNTLMFAIASLSAQRLLKIYYLPLIARNERHRWLLLGWLVLFSFVGIQMGWMLRPFIGNPASPLRFFRAEGWGNAYEALAQIIWIFLFG